MSGKSSFVSELERPPHNFPNRGPRLFAAALATLILAGCNETVARIDPPAPVRGAKIVLETAEPVRRYAGVVRARYESDLGFRVAGKIIERNVNVGDAVHAGQLVARLDPTDFKLNLEAQEAELAAAKSNRDAAAAAEHRFILLKDKGHVAQAALDQRVAAADEARSRVERADRALQVQKNQVAYTELKADGDGVVSSLSFEAGQVVAAGQIVARIARLDALEAVVAMPEQNVSSLAASTATVNLWPETTKRYAATLREVAAAADATSRTFEARFSILDSDDDVRLGKTAMVDLRTRDLRPFVRLPLSAVMNEAKGPIVWVVSADGTKITRRPVSVASFEQDSALISSGLAEGEMVVMLGVHMLDENKPVRVVETKSIAMAKPSQDLEGSAP